MNNLEYQKFTHLDEDSASGVQTLVKEKIICPGVFSSPEIKDLIGSLIKFQGEVGAAEKNKVNPFLKNAYANINSVLHCVLPVLTKHGLSIIQDVTTRDDNKNWLVTTLYHVSGQYRGSCFKLSHYGSKEDAQGISGGNTYFKRMCLVSMLGISIGEEDDDGNSISEKSEMINQKSLDALNTYTDKIKQSILSFNKVDSLTKLTQKQYDDFISRVNANKKA